MVKFRRTCFAIFLFIFGGLSSADQIGLYKTATFEFPSQFEPIELYSRFTIHNRTDKYALSSWITFSYKNTVYTIQINQYGKGKLKELTLAVGSPPESRFNEYNIADQIKYLKRNFVERPQKTKLGTRYSRFLSGWASGWSSDYLGYYLQADGPVFQECFVELFNSWQSFFPKDTLAFDIKDIDGFLRATRPDAREFYELVANIVDSAMFTSADPGQDDSLATALPKLNPRKGLFVPTIDNLRWRTRPNLSSDVIQFLPKTPGRIVDVGSVDIIDDKRGSWVRIVSDGKIGWVFDGYLRELLQHEIPAENEE